MRGKLVSVGVSVNALPAARKRNNLAHGPAGSVDNRIGIFLFPKQTLIRPALYAAGNFLDIFIILSGILVNLADRGTGNNVVELVRQNVLPSLCQFLLPGKANIPRKDCRHRRQPLRPAVQKLHFPVHALIVSLAGVSPSVVLQVQLAVPGVDILLRVFHRVVKPAEVFAGCGHFQIGKPRNFFNSSPVLQHIPVHAAAPVAVSKGNQQILIHLLFAVGVPDALHRSGRNHAVIGIKPGVPLPPGLRCGDKVGQNLASLPFESIVRHTVILVPAYLCGHKGADSGFLQNLRKRPGIAEHIGQPQKFHVLVKLFLYKSAANQNLSCERFPTG